MTAVHAGPVALVGGAEFQPGNEPHDRRCLEAAPGGRRFVVTTAAARSDPAAAAETAARWFARLGATVEPLHVLSARDARDPELAAAAAEGSLFYLAGGDPGLVVSVLAGSPVWEAMHRRWLGGAVLAGSSAGAMALCRWVLLRDGWPDRTRRRWADALDLVPDAAVVPHHDTFGRRWLPSARASAPSERAVLACVDERTAALWSHGAGWVALGRGEVRIVRGDDVETAAAGAAITTLPEPRVAVA